ncbi:MAG: family 78 glycoside hydrolase catalytic domain, partial [Chitinophagaceae bacterium]
TDKRNVQQTGYHIIVSSTEAKLKKNEGDIWNSGRVSSAQSVHVVYKGKPLTSRMTCYWKVKIFTNKGESDWRESYWTMGLLDAADWKGKWIGYDKASPWDSITQWSRLSARYFRKEFRAPEHIRRATVYIVGLGLYELYINGKKAGDRVLAPAPTDYRKSVMYNTLDVTGDLQKGANVIAAVLGNGRFFTMRQNYKTQKHNTFGYPKMLMQLEVEYEDGTKEIIASDETWKLNVDGPIRTNNEYDGEEYDATKEFKGWGDAGYDDAKWIKPELVGAPAGRIVAQMNEPMKVIYRLGPVTIKPAGPGRYILDIGRNISGWVRMNVRGERGHQVKLRYAESLQPNGELYVANLRDAKVTDIYTLKGEGEEQWHPSFVYHGFRYVEVTNYPGEPRLEDFEGNFVFDDLPATGYFNCSDSILTRIHWNARWGIASNYKGMPVDCPQRNERQPWLGDRATGSGGEAFVFDNSKLYAKWLDDIEQSQTPEGAIPDVAPAFWNYYTDNVTWPGTYLLVADLLYRHFGDERPVVKHYASMKKWMQYMQARYMKDYIVTKDKYGDWCVPPESLEMIRSRDSLRNTDGALIATAYYYMLLELMKKFAAISGNTADIASCNELSANIAAAFNKKFYRPERGCYDNNTVTANLLPLYFGITPPQWRATVFNHILNRIEKIDRSHISTGVIGTQWLLRGLTRYDRADLAFTLASNKTYPSWGYMVEQGATTIWELWNGNTANPQMNSQNHVMLLGDLLIWLYENLAGIKSGGDTQAFKTIVMKPSFVPGLTQVKAGYGSLYGMIVSEWTKKGAALSWDIQVPFNTRALVYIPAAKPANVKEGGKAVAASGDTRFIKMDAGYALFEVGSGSYHFTAE